MDNEFNKVEVMIKPGEIHIQKNSYVTLCYKLCSSQYKVLEERTATDPLIFLQGYGQLLPAVELALEGQVTGFTTSIKLPPYQAYGAYKKELVSEVARDQFAANLDLKFGMKFDTLGPEGQPIVVRILKIEDNLVTLDGNHPLAGQELIFELNVLSVRQASSEELEDFSKGIVPGTQLH